MRQDKLYQYMNIIDSIFLCKNDDEMNEQYNVIERFNEEFDVEDEMNEVFSSAIQNVVDNNFYI